MLTALHVYIFPHASADNCIINFIEQPVVTVDCNLYASERVLLTCSVSSISHTFINPNDICIKWYFNNGTEHELMVGINQTRSGNNGETIIVSSTLAISERPKQNAANLHEGSYYCRVNVADMNVVSNSSQMFVVLDIDVYLQTGTRCSAPRINFIYDVEECAVYRTVESFHATTLLDTTTYPMQEENTTKTQLIDEKQSTQPPPSSPNPSGGGTLEVWIYVLVAVAAAFAIIIIILAIMYLSLCLRQSQARHGNCKSPYNAQHCIGICAV